MLIMSIHGSNCNICIYIILYYIDTLFYIILKKVLSLAVIYWTKWVENVWTYFIGCESFWNTEKKIQLTL